jgi:hypothetical protein
MSLLLFPSHSFSFQLIVAIVISFLMFSTPSHWSQFALAVPFSLSLFPVYSFCLQYISVVFHQFGCSQFNSILLSIHFCGSRIASIVSEPSLLLPIHLFVPNSFMSLPLRCCCFQLICLFLNHFRYSYFGFVVLDSLLFFQFIYAILYSIVHRSFQYP